MRWFALLRKWGRLYQELVGADINKFLSIVICGVVVFSMYRNFMNGFSINIVDMLNIVIMISVAGIAYLVWHSRPYRLRKTLVNIGWVMLLVTILTIFLVPAERLLIR